MTVSPHNLLRSSGQTTRRLFFGVNLPLDPSKIVKASGSLGSIGAGSSTEARGSCRGAGACELVGIELCCRRIDGEQENHNGSVIFLSVQRIVPKSVNVTLMINMDFFVE